jgi:polyisoprenoid-binding protein YceI
MKRHLATIAVLALAACSQKPAPTAKDVAATPPAAARPASDAPAGQYEIDPAHTNLSFKVTHLGFSHYTADFDRVTGKLSFDPAHPAAMTVEARIDPMSLDLNAPPAGFHDELMGEGFFNAKLFPAITFKSTRVEVTGPATAKVTGDLTLHGVTRPVTMDVTFNGGWKANAYDGDRIGFSAHGMLKRSEFGMGNGVPAPGSSMGVSDQVDFAIETEFQHGTKVKAGS